MLSTLFEKLKRYCSPIYSVAPLQILEQNEDLKSLNLSPYTRRLRGCHSQGVYCYDETP